MYEEMNMTIILLKLCFDGGRRANTQKITGFRSIVGEASNGPVMNLYEH
jgi:hypothetical protein